MIFKTNHSSLFLSRMEIVSVGQMLCGQRRVSGAEDAGALSSSAEVEVAVKRPGFQFDGRCFDSYRAHCSRGGTQLCQVDSLAENIFKISHLYNLGVFRDERSDLAWLARRFIFNIFPCAWPCRPTASWIFETSSLMARMHITGRHHIVTLSGLQFVSTIATSEGPAISFMHSGLFKATSK